MEPIVDVEGLTVKFGAFTAVDDISFTVNKKEIFGFIGANGAGKTTTIRTLCGLLTPTAGRVRIAGLEYKDGVQAIKAKVGYMSQKFTLYNDLNVSENFSFAANLRKLERDVFEKRMKELLGFLEFTPPLETLVRNLPVGFKQELALAASLLHDPDLIFLDEPTAGVSPAARKRFWTLIRQLSESGKTVFVTTHYLDEAEECDRIALMSNGQIIAVDSPEDLKKKTYPEPLYEIEPREKASAGWLEELQKHEAVASLQPYGLRYHVLPRDPKKWAALAERMTSSFSTRPIPPSLEDVFIRLVEGGNR
ncbi:MAG: ABC transporter ATP-binding protein [Elusimicrobia bacterium]|nr:ABC transporter ATP-binding protein [Candidatus Obscuribacterium magneticum]